MHDIMFAVSVEQMRGEVSRHIPYMPFFSFSVDSRAVVGFIIELLLSSVPVLRWVSSSYLYQMQLDGGGKCLLHCSEAKPPGNAKRGINEDR